jgi:thymidylate kinase
LLNVLDLSLQYNWSVRRRLLVGNVVVCDRYAADAEIELESRLPDDDRLARRLVRLISVLSPQARVAFLLDLAADQAAQRSADSEDARELQARRNDYLRMAAQRHMTVVDAGREFTALNDEIVRLALYEYFGRFGTLLNALLLSNPEQLNVSAGRLLREVFR